MGQVIYVNFNGLFKCRIWQIQIETEFQLDRDFYVKFTFVKMVESNVYRLQSIFVSMEPSYIEWKFKQLINFRFTKSFMLFFFQFCWGEIDQNSINTF